MPEYSATKVKPFSHYEKKMRTYITEKTKIVLVPPRDKDHPRNNELHPSSYPFCALKHAWYEANGLEEKQLDYYGDFYTSVGTITHELMQKYLGYRGTIIGEWVCCKCKTIHKKNRKPIVSPKKCKKCKHTVFDYQELGISFRKYTRGHMDGIIEIDGKYFVIDYKTTSPAKNEKHRKFKNVYPYKKNKAQIESYTVYVEQEYDIKISGWMLIYVSRDNNFKDYVIIGDMVSEKRKAELLKKYTRDDKLFGIVLKLRKGYDWERWSKLIKYKPCATNAEYKEKMHEYDTCDLAKDGTCFNKKRLQNAVKNLNRKIKVVNKL